MGASRNTALTNILATKICIANDITDTIYKCSSNLVRICAKTDVILKSSSNNIQGDGLYLPQGSIEYYQVEEGEILTITGTANLSSIC